MPSNRWSPYDLKYRRLISSMLDQYVEEHVKPNVVAKERQMFAIQALKPFFGKQLCDKITLLTCREYRRQRNAEGVSDSTVRREMAVLRAAIHHAHKSGKILLSQIPFIELPPENPTNCDFLTKKELRSLYEVADERTQDFIALAYFTASRRGAIERMDKTQIDLEHGLIFLDKPNARKTNKRRPVVPIDDGLRPTVEKILNREGLYVLGKPGPVYEPFMRAVAKAQIDPKKHVTPHTLRHSRATHLLMAGETIYKVAKLLGDTVATVERVYGHYSQDYLRTTTHADLVLGE